MDLCPRAMPGATNIKPLWGLEEKEYCKENCIARTEVNYMEGSWLAAPGMVADSPEGRQPEMRKDAKFCVSTECSQRGRKAA